MYTVRGLLSCKYSLFQELKLMQYESKSKNNSCMKHGNIYIQLICGIPIYPKEFVIIFIVIFTSLAQK